MLVSEKILTIHAVDKIDFNTQYIILQFFEMIKTVLRILLFFCFKGIIDITSEYQLIP